MIFPYCNPAHWWIARILNEYLVRLKLRMVDRRRWNTSAKATAGRIGRRRYEERNEPGAEARRTPLPPGEATSTVV